MGWAESSRGKTVLVSTNRCSISKAAGTSFCSAKPTVNGVNVMDLQEKGNVGKYQSLCYKGYSLSSGVSYEREEINRLLAKGF